VACFRATGFRAEELREAAVPLVRLPAGSLMRPSTLAGAFRFGQYLRKHRIRLVHTYDTPMNLFGAPTARAFRVPVVLSSQRAYRQLTPPFGRRLLRVTDRLVDGVVVNCEALRRHLIEEEGTRARKVQLCYNGIDTDTFQPKGFAGGGLTIGAVCALRPEKDLGTLLRAFAGVRKTYPAAGLLIVGSGPSGAGLESLSRELDLGASCHFEPATRDVAPWMHAIDIFVLPSLSEALSNSLMEAMACGCCPVASELGGNPELVIPMKTGLLFRPGDAADLQSKLELLIRETALRQTMQARAAETIAHKFSLAASARRMGEIYLHYLEKRVPKIR
jgi:glycosyltransferase involved in cell wall biosynthesis